MRPDGARRTSFYGTKATAQLRINRLLRLVGLRRWGGSEKYEWIWMPLQDVEAGHGRAERLHTKRRAGLHASGYAAAGIREGIDPCNLTAGAGKKWIQTADWS
ncbi:MAG: hypothetical protein WA738_02470 [Candidatus Angelobacter sp.]